MLTENIANTYNFFEISNRNVLFWGLDIPSLSIRLTNENKKLIRELGLSLDEVIEIYDDETMKLFDEIYQKTFNDSRKN